jgi:cholinesterase
MRGRVAIALWLCASELTVALPPQSSFETVETENGKITGHRSPKAQDVWEYLGVPYAQPPLGDLRFAAPQGYKAKGPYNAAKFVSAHFTCKMTGLTTSGRDSKYERSACTLLANQAQ